MEDDAVLREVVKKALEGKGVLAQIRVRNPKLVRKNERSLTTATLLQPGRTGVDLTNVARDAKASLSNESLEKLRGTSKRVGLFRKCNGR